MDLEQATRKFFSTGRRQALAGLIAGVAAPLLTGSQVGEAKKGKNKNKNKKKCNRCPQQGCCSCVQGNVPVACSLLEPGADIDATADKCKAFCATLGIGNNVGDGTDTFQPSAVTVPFCTTDNRCVAIACPVI